MAAASLYLYSSRAAMLCHVCQHDCSSLQQLPAYSCHCNAIMHYLQGAEGTGRSQERCDDDRVGVSWGS